MILIVWFGTSLVESVSLLNFIVLSDRCWSGGLNLIAQVVTELHVPLQVLMNALLELGETLLISQSMASLAQSYLRIRSILSHLQPLSRRIVLAHSCYSF